MHQARYGHYALLAAVLLLCPAASALEVGANLGVGLEYTDNATQVSSNEEDDWIVDSSVGVSLSENAGALNAEVIASFSHQEYLNDSFDGQDYLNLNALALWEPVKNRFKVRVEDYYSQVPIDTLDSDTPDNKEDANIFSLEPEFRIQVTPRNSIILTPQFQDYYYERDDLDNQQYGVSVGWQYNMYPTVVVGLNVIVREVSYDNEALNPSYTVSTFETLFSRTLSRSKYKISLGATNIDRDQFENQDGATGSFDWLYQLTAKSSLRAYLSSSLTDASNDLLRSAADPGTGDFTNERITSDVLRNNTMRFTYQNQSKGAAFDTIVWGELRDLDYAESPDDLEVQEFGINLAYQISSLLTTGINGEYSETKQLSDGRTDKVYTLGGNVAYKLSRKLRCNFGVRYEQKDSTQLIDEYDEFSVFAGLVYDIFGRRSSLIPGIR